MCNHPNSQQILNVFKYKKQNTPKVQKIQSFLCQHSSKDISDNFFYILFIPTKYLFSKNL